VKDNAVKLLKVLRQKVYGKVDGKSVLVAVRVALDIPVCAGSLGEMDPHAGTLQA
jgi:hypothetical protein